MQLEVPKRGDPELILEGESEIGVAHFAINSLVNWFQRHNTFYIGKRRDVKKAKKELTELNSELGDSLGNSEARIKGLRKIILLRGAMSNPTTLYELERSPNGQIYTDVFRDASTLLRPVRGTAVRILPYGMWPAGQQPGPDSLKKPYIDDDLLARSAAAK